MEFESLASKMNERKWEKKRKGSKNMCHWEFLFLGDDMEVADDWRQTFQ